MKTISKIAAIALVAVALVGVNTASAATVAELQAMIASLSAQIAALSGTTSTTASAGYTFSTNLTVGSKGADVTALQNFLIKGGYNTLATGYFGPMTKAALAAYQTAKGITPAVGYFGPITQAKVNAEAPVVVTPGTTTGGTISTTGVEGSFTTKLAANPSTQTSIKSTENVPVIGFDIKAKDSDVKVDRIDLKVAVSNSNGTLAPSAFIRTIQITDGSNVLATKSVSSSDFSKDSGIYHIRLTNIGLVVPKDVTKTLTVNMSVNSIGSGDLDKVLTVSGYTNDAIRGTDGAGFDQYSNNADTLSRTQTFTQSGVSTLAVTDDVNKIKTTNVKLDSVDGAKGVTVGSFNVKSTTGDSKVTDITLTTTGSKTPTSVYLYDGSTVLGSYSGSSTIVFTDLTVAVSKDVTKTLTIKADYSASGATTSTSTITVTSVSYDKPDGTSQTVSASVASNPVTLVTSATPVFTLVSAGAPSIVSNQNGSTTKMDASVTFKVSAVGGTLTRSSIVVVGKWATSSTAASAGSSVNLQITPSTDVNDGAEATVVVSSTLTAPSTSDYYGFYITSIASTVGGNAVTQTTGLDDYHTTNAYYLK